MVSKDRDIWYSILSTPDSILLLEPTYTEMAWRVWRAQYYNLSTEITCFDYLLCSLMQLNTSKQTFEYSEIIEAYM